MILGNAFLKSQRTGAVGISMPSMFHVLLQEDSQQSRLKLACWSIVDTSKIQAKDPRVAAVEEQLSKRRR